MGQLVNGEWQTEALLAKNSNGKFKRQDLSFRNWLSDDPDAEFPAEAGRYHLYVSYACPWAHRTLIYRALKGLEDMITVSVVHWYMGDRGWQFSAADGLVDDLHGHNFMHQVYASAEPDYTGRVTVPVLWDKKTNRIVSNESSEIIRMFNNAFDGIGATEGDYYPEHLRAEIDAVNERVYHDVNNGVYKSGFATSQDAYEEAVTTLFETLDWLEDRLSRQRFLVGDQVTEADWRLFPTLLRFDPVYHGHFKCNLKMLHEYPNLWNYTKSLYQHPGVKGTVHMDHIKKHYYQSHSSVNPSGVVPIGPELDLDSPHDRF
ncbi:MAG: glutathione S-transferase family protein [Porticoccaceae bacterium]|uniref:glutathione S-transferase family protein n=1 Tax=Thalassospira sp. TaxID=1912094 RepID=UPI003A889E1A